MSEPVGPALRSTEPGQIQVSGRLDFETVARSLKPGEAIIAESPTKVRIDLANVSAGDSAGLALMIEWLSFAKSNARQLHFDNVPPQLLQLARLSDLEPLLAG